jgi:hypothetical protein
MQHEQPDTTHGVASHGLRRRIRSHPVPFAGITLTAVVLIAVVLVWFQPQALLFDRVVDEAPPTADVPPEPATRDAASPKAATPEPATPEPPVTLPPPEPERPAVLSRGSFTSRNRYTVEGQALVHQLADGSRLLRLEDFSSTNGPDLFVYLTAAAADGSDEDMDADFVDLGVLKGNIGNQNYEIPGDVDLDRYATVVIWCRRFTVSFGAADLAAAGRSGAAVPSAQSSGSVNTADARVP